MRRITLAFDRTFRSLRIRNYRFFFLGQIVSVSGHVDAVPGAGMAGPGTDRERACPGDDRRAAVHADAPGGGVGRRGRRSVRQTAHLGGDAIGQRVARAHAGGPRRHRRGSTLDGVPPGLPARTGEPGGHAHPASLRDGDGRFRERGERGQPEQRGGQRGPDRGPCRRRGPGVAVRGGGLLLRQRHLVPGRDRRAAGDASG